MIGTISILEVEGIISVSPLEKYIIGFTMINIGLAWILYFKEERRKVHIMELERLDSLMEAPKRQWDK